MSRKKAFRQMPEGLIFSEALYFKGFGNLFLRYTISSDVFRTGVRSPEPYNAIYETSYDIQKTIKRQGVRRKCRPATRKPAIT